MELSTEEFSSNESGWTMYLGSPSEDRENHSSVVDNDDYSYNHVHDHLSRNGGGKHKENEDNDSTTSDASSGPRSSQAGPSKCSQGKEGEEYFCGNGDKTSKEMKGKAGKMATIVSKAKGALKQKTGKKTD